jgi:antitoxin MazE6
MAQRVRARIFFFMAPHSTLDTRPLRLATVGAHDYTFGMKTAISIPDKVLAEAERLSRRLKKSRSQVYTEAVTKYIAGHDPEPITEAMNRVCEAVDTYPDPAIAAAARRTLEDIEW